MKRAASPTCGSEEEEEEEEASEQELIDDEEQDLVEEELENTAAEDQPSPLDGAVDLLQELGRLKQHHPTSERGSLTFMLLDINIQYDRRQQTLVYLYGRTMQGCSCFVSVTGWTAFLLVRAPKQRWTGSALQCATLTELLNANAEARAKRDPVLLDRFLKLKNPSVVSRIATLSGRCVMGYTAENVADESFLRIEVISPLVVGLLRDCFQGYAYEDEQGKPAHARGMHPAAVARPNGGDGEAILADGPAPTFESNIDPILQYLVDAGACGCQWARVRTSGMDASGISRCDIEASVAMGDVTWISPEEMPDVPPLRVLSYDIEAAGRRGVFPDSAIDPAIQIAVKFHIMAPSAVEPPKSVLLNLRSCDPIDDSHVVCYAERQEGLMVRDFARLIELFDADIVTGYNINNFDFPYLEGRAKVFGVQERFYQLCSRNTRAKLRIIEAFFDSCQTGRRQRNKIIMPGRMVFDMYTYATNEMQGEESFKLDSLAEKFLGDKKEDIHFTQITPMWNRDAAARRDLGVYCLKDALLPVRLMEKLNAVLNVVERARVTGLPADWILRRGMMVRFSSLLLRKCRERGFFVPYVQNQQPQQTAAAAKKNAFTGATVLAIVRGIHRYVTVLDFSAMYPSIIIAHNLCYSTYLTTAAASGEVCGAYEAVRGHRFAPASVRKGVVPEILEHLLMQRKAAKKALATETDPIRQKIKKACELAYKVTCNGVYGTLGCSNALLPLRAIAETVTATGRRDIDQVKRMAESMFTPDKGYRGRALVVCGDTDSVFVRLEDVIAPELLEHQMDGLGEAIRLGTLLADAVNAVMTPPKRIEYEKVYRVLLSMNKKRYAGLKFTEPTSQPVMDIKGVECVRRDGCMLVRDTVRQVLDRIIYQGDIQEAGGYVRAVVEDIILNRVPPRQYAIKKVLRKSIQDCSKPMTPAELRGIRRALLKDPEAQVDEAAPLTYAEQDDAIRARIALPWRLRVSLAHVITAWKMRLVDPGNAPVLGESVWYVVTLNGGKKISEKAETPENVEERHIQVDRRYYLDRIRRAVDNIFSPVFQQQVVDQAFSDPCASKRICAARADSGLEGQVQALLEHHLWRRLNEPLHTSSEQKRACIAASPIAKAFFGGGAAAHITLKRTQPESQPQS